MMVVVGVVAVLALMMVPAYTDRLVSQYGVTRDHVFDSPFICLGSPERIAEHLIAVRERYGISCFAFPSAEDFAPVVALLGRT